jgi:hypothetical protein
VDVKGRLLGRPFSFGREKPKSFEEVCEKSGKLAGDGRCGFQGVNDAREFRSFGCAELEEFDSVAEVFAIANASEESEACLGIWWLKHDADLVTFVKIDGDVNGHADES